MTREGAMRMAIENARTRFDQILRELGCEEHPSRWVSDAHLLAKEGYESLREVLRFIEVSE